jgi:oxygen-independent coproporphyrinogen-3 oxidase
MHLVIVRASDHAQAEGALGLYAHVPFCQAKCGYCDFYSVPIAECSSSAYVQAVLRELAGRLPARPISTVFVGGGTPTILPAAELGLLLGALTRAAPEVFEFTVEANPASADELKLSLLRECGVNRLSLGAQSFDDGELSRLGRIHQSRQIVESVAAARAAGFDNINLDLIHGIPGQTVESWRTSLRRGVDLDPEHLSCYSLTYEPGTDFSRRRECGEITACDEALEAELFELTIDELTAAGFEHYEISNFARPGRRCRANIIYWMNREYLGVGPSAVSYLGGVRRRNVADVGRYLELVKTGPDAAAAEEERLAPRARAGETAIQMLRMTEGIDEAVFQRSTSFDPRTLFAEQIDRFTTGGLLVAVEGAIRLTRRGLLVANRVMEEFLPDA